MVSSQDVQAEIRTIVDRACSLALDFGMQRCRWQVFAPQPGQTISKASTNFKDANDTNPPDLAKGVVQLLISPGLRKTGDGRGGCLDSSSDLCPAVVYLKATSN
jgi:hypothetical protein